MKRRHRDFIVIALICSCVMGLAYFLKVQDGSIKFLIPVLKIRHEKPE